MFSRLLSNKILSKVIKYFSILLMAAFCVSLLIPIFWMFYTSFKDPIEYFMNAFKFPEEWILDNFKTVLPLLKVPLLTDRGEVIFGVVDMLIVSTIWATTVPFVNLFFCLICAYVISKYEFKGKNFMFMLGIFVMITPIIGSLPSAMVIKSALGIYDNMFLQIITAPGVAFSGLWFLLFHAGFKRIPWSYAEAAFIDGAGHFVVMFKFMIPMMIPTFMGVYILSFLGTWNDYGTFILWLPSYANLAYGMYLFQMDASTYGATIPQILAGFIYCMIPTIIIYLCSQKLILSKLTVGGLKG